MHPSAFEFGRRFLESYSNSKPGRILDVGSREVNGSLRIFRPPEAEYVGVDVEAGAGVDVVLEDPYVYPFDADNFDLIVCTSCLEHDQMFWLTFLECLRVLKPTGFAYFNCPSNGPYHGYPVDCWRFYSDAGMALQNWGRRNRRMNWLVESFIGPIMHGDDTWRDNVMIFSRTEPNLTDLRFLSDLVPNCESVYRISESEHERLELPTKAESGVRRTLPPPTHSGMHYTAFMEQLFNLLNPQSYFEVGTNTGVSLKSFQCDALCIDPAFQIDREAFQKRRRLFCFQMTSDEFFRADSIRRFLPNGPDIAFLDGMHRFEYLLRDFINTERECHSRSLILLHDCLPTNERMAERAFRIDESESPESRHSWTGDVWRMLPILSKYRPDLQLLVLDCPPTGLVVCTDLDPKSRVLDDNYRSIIGEFVGVALSEYGLDRLWEEFQPVSSISLLGPPYSLSALLAIY